MSDRERKIKELISKCENINWDIKNVDRYIKLIELKTSLLQLSRKNREHEPDLVRVCSLIKNIEESESEKQTN